MNQPRNLSRAMLEIARAHAGLLAVVLAIGLTQCFVGMYSLTFFQRIIDALPAAHKLADLSAPLAAYIGLTVLNHILIYSEGYPNSLLKNGIYQWVKLRALDKLARIDYAAYQNLGTGNLVQNIENGSGAARDLLKGFYFKIIREIIPQVVIGLAFIGSYDRTIFWAVVAGYLLLYPVTNFAMRYLRTATERMLSNQEDFSRFSVRAFMEMVVFRVNGRFKAEIERIRGISDEIVRARATLYLIQELFYSGFALLIFLIEAGVIFQQVTRILAGQSTVGALVALVAFIRLVFWPIPTLSAAWMEYRMNAIAYARLADFLSLPEDAALSRGRALAFDGAEIRLEQVDFTYPNRPVFENFSLTIPGGQTTAVVGFSGSGKTTLVKLILGLLKPNRGSVRVAGQDLAGVALESYYERIAYIPQEPPVFDGTLRENLTFGRPVSPAQLSAAIAKVGLDGLLTKLPAGLETEIGERGVKLSGGERQRLAFCRVLLQDPRIIILDEPTSALDSLTEEFIDKHLSVFFAGRTVLVVAHRLQTVRGADTLIVLENGKVVEQGRFSQLIAGAGSFRRFWEAQVREAAAEANN